MASPPPGAYVPYLRRRNTPEQRDALNQLFKTTAHPTRAQRQAIAKEIGMDPKSVTNWFQNRRQMSRRKALSAGENNPPATRLEHSSARPRQRPLNRHKISLDHIAALSERPSLTSQLNSAHSPLTPRKRHVQQTPSELWTHMLSSPVVPPSSPGHEEARLVALSSRKRSLYPLEWACLNARQKKWVDEDAEASTRPVSKHDRQDGARDGGGPSSLQFSHPDMMPQIEDVEAAITLLGFKMGS